MSVISYSEKDMIGCSAGLSIFRSCADVENLVAYTSQSLFLLLHGTNLPIITLMIPLFYWEEVDCARCTCGGFNRGDDKRLHYVLTIMFFKIHL